MPLQVLGFYYVVQRSSSWLVVRGAWRVGYVVRGSCGYVWFMWLAMVVCGYKILKNFMSLDGLTYISLGEYMFFMKIISKSSQKVV